jgi:hypothetical protein
MAVWNGAIEVSRFPNPGKNRDIGPPLRTKAEPHPGVAANLPFSDPMRYESRLLLMDRLP